MYEILLQIFSNNIKIYFFILNLAVVSAHLFFLGSVGKCKEVGHFSALLKLIKEIALQEMSKV